VTLLGGFTLLCGSAVATMTAGLLAAWLWVILSGLAATWGAEPDNSERERDWDGWDLWLVPERLALPAAPTARHRASRCSRWVTQPTVTCRPRSHQAVTS